MGTAEAVMPARGISLSVAMLRPLLPIYVLSLLSWVKKDELGSVIVVRRMLPAFLNTGSGFNPLDIIRALAGGNAGRQGTVTLVYKVDLKTGKEELIRGARLKSVPRKKLADDGSGQ
jgi:hypothetical protein